GCEPGGVGWQGGGGGWGQPRPPASTCPREPPACPRARRSDLPRRVPLRALVSDHAILWRRLDRAGHEAARLFATPSGFGLDGTAVFLHEDRACGLDYAIRCDGGWRTGSARVRGFIGAQLVEGRLSVGGAGPRR